MKDATSKSGIVVIAGLGVCEGPQLNLTLFFFYQDESMSLPTRRERQQNDIQRKYSRDTVYENREKEDVPSKNIKRSSSFTLTIPGIPSPLQLPLSPHRVSFSSSYKSNRLIDPLLPIEEYRPQQRFNLEQ